MDEELVAKAKDGDPGAFRTLAIEQHPRLFAAAYGILRDRTWPRRRRSRRSSTYGATSGACATPRASTPGRTASSSTSAMRRPGAGR